MVETATERPEPATALGTGRQDRRRRATDVVRQLPSSPVSDYQVREAQCASRDAIALRAYELFVARGGEHGHDVEDWLRAERELAPPVTGAVLLTGELAEKPAN